MQTFAEQFEDYMIKLYGHHGPNWREMMTDGQYLQTRQAFYAGAITAFNALTQDMPSVNDGPTYVASMRDELSAFAKEETERAKSSLI